MKIVKRFNEQFATLFDNGEYCIVKNCKTKDYSFGLWRDFYDLYYFPINQSCQNWNEEYWKGPIFIYLGHSSSEHTV